MVSTMPTVSSVALAFKHQDNCSPPLFFSFWGKDWGAPVFCQKKRELASFKTPTGTATPSALKKEQ
jgi:hypothetical protein